MSRPRHAAKKPRRSWVVHATVIRVIDADSFVADLDLGWDLRLSPRTVRVARIDAPELDTAAGKVARDRARQLLPVGAEVVLLSHSLDKYGRALAEVTLPDGRDYADVMLAEGHAVDYATGKPAPP